MEGSGEDPRDLGFRAPLLGKYLVSDVLFIALRAQPRLKTSLPHLSSCLGSMRFKCRASVRKGEGPVSPGDSPEWTRALRLLN